MAPGTSFQYVLSDPSAERDPSKVTQVVLCSGKHYYALDKYRREQERTDVAIVRMEVSLGNGTCTVYPNDVICMMLFL